MLVTVLVTGCRRVVVVTYASYLGNHSFESWLGDYLN